MDESYLVEQSTTKAFEDEIQSILSIVLASDENRRATFQLTHGEQQQNVAVGVQVPVLLRHSISFPSTSSPLFPTKFCENFHSYATTIVLL